MAVYSPIQASERAAGQPVKESLMARLDLNPHAIMEGDPTAVAEGKGVFVGKNGRTALITDVNSHYKSVVSPPGSDRATFGFPRLRNTVSLSMNSDKSSSVAGGITWDNASVSNPDDTTLTVTDARVINVTAECLVAVTLSLRWTSTTGRELQGRINGSSSALVAHLLGDDPARTDAYGSVGAQACLGFDRVDLGGDINDGSIVTSINGGLFRLSAGSTIEFVAAERYGFWNLNGPARVSIMNLGVL